MRRAVSPLGQVRAELASAAERKIVKGQTVNDVPLIERRDRAILLARAAEDDLSADLAVHRREDILIGAGARRVVDRFR